MAHVLCKRCSGWTDCVQGSGTWAERGAKGVESHVCSAGGWVLGVPIVGSTRTYPGSSLIWTFRSPSLSVHLGGSRSVCAWQPSTPVQLCVPSLASAVGSSGRTCSVVGVEVLRVCTRSKRGACTRGFVLNKVTCESTVAAQSYYYCCYYCCFC